MWGIITFFVIRVLTNVGITTYVVICFLAPIAASMPCILFWSIRVVAGFIFPIGYYADWAF